VKYEPPRILWERKINPDGGQSMETVKAFVAMDSTDRRTPRLFLIEAGELTADQMEAALVLMAGPDAEHPVLLGEATVAWYARGNPTMRLPTLLARLDAVTKLWLASPKRELGRGTLTRLPDWMQEPMALLKVHGSTQVVGGELGALK
jgi:hypothetical protein